MPLLNKYLTFVAMLIIFSTTAVAMAKQEPFDIKHIINKIPFDELLENDEITNEQLSILLSSKQDLKKNNSNTNDDAIWNVDKHDRNTIIIHSENEKWVLRTYPMQENKKLLLVNTQLGNHQQTQNYAFFIYSEGSDNLSKKIEKDQFIPDVKENEFLTDDQKFPESKQGNVNLHMNEDGTISATPWIWMEKRWENKQPAFRILFKWEKNKFIKIKEKL